MEETCKLCKNEEADKKGSHIVPHFLLKRVENIEGHNERDYELGFTIEKGKTSSHFGRAVLPEKLEEIYGEVSEKDLENNLHPLVVDNYFCSRCENRFAVIESEYSKIVSQIGNGEYPSGNKVNLGILFWSSVIWRMSINGRSGMKLNNTQNEVFRKILDEFMPNTLQEADFENMNENGLTQSISYKLLRCNNCPADSSKWMLFYPKSENPLCLFIDEFVIVFSLNSNFDLNTSDDYLGISELINEASINILNEDEIITAFDYEDFQKVSLNIIEIAKNEYITGLYELLDELHIKIGQPGNAMPLPIKKAILREIALGEKEFGRRYTTEDVVNSTIKVISN